MAGRPTEFTNDMRQKIEDAAALGCSDTEIALYCDISRQTLYNWKDKYPEIVDRIIELRERPILKARKTVIESLNKPEYAFKFLEKKKKDEFGNTLDLTTGGDKLNKFDDEQISTIADRISRRSGGDGDSRSEE